MKLWHTGCDSDWHLGYSTCTLQRTERNTALFHGHLDTTLPKVRTRIPGFRYHACPILQLGYISKTGFANFRTRNRTKFGLLNVPLLGNSREHTWQHEIQHFTHLIAMVSVSLVMWLP